MSTIAIVEPHCAGHRMQYVRWISREALAQGHDVCLITLAYCLEHPLYATMQHECEGRISTSIFPDNGDLQSEKWLAGQTTAGLVRREFVYHSLFSTYFRKLSAGEQPDFAFVPYLDYCTNAIGLAGSPFGEIPWGGIVMRTAFHFESVGVRGPVSRLQPVKKKLFLGTLRDKRLRRIFTIDETLAEYMDRHRSELSDKLRFTPDPVRLEGTQTREEARRRLGLPEDAVTILVYGALSLRKGIDGLLDAARQPEFPEEAHVLLAGRQDEEVRRLLASPQARKLRESGRIHEHDRFLSDDEEYAAFRAADMVWLGYRGHYAMSGVLVQAGMMGAPVVACDEGLIGWLTRRHRLGLSLQTWNPKSIAATVKRLAHDQDLAGELGENGKKFSTAHTADLFTQGICKEWRLDRSSADAPRGNSIRGRLRA